MTLIRLLIVAAIAFSLTGPSVTFAQEPDKADTSAEEAQDGEESSDPQVVPDQEGGEADDSGDADDEDAPEKIKPLREQTIYIPYSKIRGIFEKEGRGVFIPYEQFQSLWKQARAAQGAQPEDPKPPVSALITEINSEAVVEESVVRTTANLKIEVLGSGWHEVPLRLGDAAILTATLDGSPARIVNRGGSYMLLVEKKGKASKQYELEIVYAKAFTKSPGRNTVSFQSPQAPVNQWRIRVPQSGVKVNITPMIAQTEEKAGNGDGEDGDNAKPKDETVVLAFVGAAPSVRIDWTPRSEGASGMAALATANSQQELTISEGVVRATTRLSYDISRAELSELAIDVPAEYIVKNVLDPNVRAWPVEKTKTGQRINVQLFEPAKGTQNLVIELERFSETLLEEELEAPVVKAVGVGRQHGLVVVRLASALRAEVTQRTGLLQLDGAELPKAMQAGNWDFAYRFSSLPTRLRLSLEKVKPRVQATQVVEAYVEPEQITMHLSAIYTIERAGIFQLSFEVPSDYEIRSVRGQASGGVQAAQYDSHNLDADGKLLVNLAAKALGKVGLFIELERRLDDPNLLAPTGESTEIPLPLPRIDEESVEHSTGKFVVYAPESLRVNPTTTDGLQPISFSDAMVGFASPRAGRFPSTRPILAYAHSASDTDLTIDTQRRKPQITARQLLETSVEAGSVEYKATFLYDIRFSGVKALRIDVPVAPDIRNVTASIQDVRIEPQPDDVAEGYEAWSFSGETELLGTSEIQLRWTEKLTGLGIGKSKDVDIPRIQPQEVDREWGQVVIRKAETLDVRPKGEPTGLRPIDPQTDLMDGRRVEGAARAFEFHEDWKLAITATRYELEDVKHTSIERAVLRMVVGADEQTSVQALYKMRSAQQRLQVKLPAAFDPAKGFNQNPLRINGRPVPLERGDAGEYYVPLANQSPEQAFVLELRYAVETDQRQLSLPEFPNDPAVQKVYLCAYLPKDQAVLGATGPWDNDLSDKWQRHLAGYRYQPPNDKGLVSWVTEGVSLPSSPTSDFQTQGTLYTFSTVRPPTSAKTAGDDPSALHVTTMSRDMFDGIVFLLIAVPGVVLVTQSLGVRVFAVGAVLLGLVFSGVFLPSLSLQLFDNVLFLAIFLVLAVWTLLGLLRWYRGPVQRSSSGEPSSPDQDRPPSDSAPGMGAAMAGAGGAVMFQDSNESPSGLFGEGGIFGWNSREGGQQS